jgi:Leucine-rich repeat (LRR) protein
MRIFFVFFILLLTKNAIAQTITSADIAYYEDNCIYSYGGDSSINNLFDNDESTIHPCSSSYIDFATNSNIADNLYVESITFKINDTNVINSLAFSIGAWSHQAVVDLNGQTSYTYTVKESVPYSGNFGVDIADNTRLSLKDLVVNLREKIDTDPTPISIGNTLNQYIDFSNSRIYCTGARYNSSTSTPSGIDVDLATSFVCDLAASDAIRQEISFTESVDITKIKIVANKESSGVDVYAYSGDDRGGIKTSSSTETINVNGVQRIDLHPLFSDISGTTTISDIIIYGKKSSEESNTETDGGETPNPDGDGGETPNPDGDGGETPNPDDGSNTNSNNKNISVTYTAFIIKNATNPSTVSLPQDGGSLPTITDDCKDGSLEAETITGLNTGFSAVGYSGDSSYWCSLTYISLYNIGFAWELPSEIGTLSNLNGIDLYNTGITSIPDSICHLNSLSEFMIGEPLVTSLPSCIGELKNVSTFRIGNTGISTLPDSFGDMSSITQLSLQNTSLSSLPSSIGRMNLREIYITDSPNLTTLPSSIADIDTLISVSLRFNSGFTGFPLELYTMVNLEYLGSYHNPNFTSMPANIIGLEGLKTIDLTGSGFSTLPNEINTLGQNYSLRYFNATSNPGSFTNINCAYFTTGCWK